MQILRNVFKRTLDRGGGKGAHHSVEGDENQVDNFLHRREQNA